MANIFQFESNLKITGSFGYEFTMEIPIGKKLNAGATAQAFQVTDKKNGNSMWLDFHGIGTGVGVGKSIFGKIGVGGGPSALPSKGSPLYGGLLNIGEVELDELINKPGLIISGSATPGYGAAIGLTVVIFNPVPAAPFPLPLSWHSIAVVVGLSVASAAKGGSAGAMQYYGMFSKGENYG
ncbi:MAG: hypothetical protein M3Q99_11605 [Acidobacteriota bacterium]|nr:hypothetical protein [Acidobacteriota bacterium]